MKIIIQKYFHEKGIIIKNKSLIEDIKTNENPSLIFIKYAIENLSDIKGVNELLQEIAILENDEIKYHNNITELYGLYFVHKILKHKILEVESRSNKIYSPHNKGDKSCDIMAKYEDDVYYFETKDSSYEKKSQKLINGRYHFTPICENKLKNWILKQSKESCRKGANYLICKMPIWKEPEYPSNEAWLKKVFGEYPRINNIIDLNRFSFFKGIYIIGVGHGKIDGYIAIH